MFEPLAIGARSLAARLVLLAAVFAAVPLVLYGQFHEAEEARRTTLLASLQAEGRLIAHALAMGLEAAAGPAVAETQAILERLDPRGTTVRLLLRPALAPSPSVVAGTGAGVEAAAGSGAMDAVQPVQAVGLGDAGGETVGLYLVGALPPPPPGGLESERRELGAAGLASLVPVACAGAAPLDLRYSSPNDGDEILTSLTAFAGPGGCWVVLTSHSLRELAGSLLGTPYWQAPEVRAAAIIYAALALLVMTLFGGLWRSLHRFGRKARAVAAGATGNGAFAQDNRIPELAGVAEEFDRMVAGLRGSAEAFRIAAEENAHAFKTPIATIAQAIEPLRAAVPETQARGRRALQVIEASVARLDVLVTAARQMDETNARLVNPPRERIDLSALAETIVRSYEDMLGDGSVRFQRVIAPGCGVWAGPDLLETVIENILDNAVSFSPEGGAVTVRVARERRSVVLIVEDEGPGAPRSVLETMFERYVSHRAERRPQPGGAAGGTGVADNHFGIGLWIVRRNVTAIGGTVRAENRPSGGLRIVISLRRAG